MGAAATHEGFPCTISGGGQPNIAACCCCWTRKPRELYVDVCHRRVSVPSFRLFCGKSQFGQKTDICLSERLPEWMTGDNGVRDQKRVWKDLLEILKIKGHAVDLSGL